MDSRTSTTVASPDGLVVPDYGGACISNIVPALLDPSNPWPTWIPEVAADADQVVLLVLDGIGWNQLRDRQHLAPTLSTMVGGPITSVAPSTTATALTSISTGVAPGLHGIMGYRMAIGRDVLNVLRWSANGRDTAKCDSARIDSNSRGVRGSASACDHSFGISRLRIHSCPSRQNSFDRMASLFNARRGNCRSCATKRTVRVCVLRRHRQNCA